MISTVSKSSTLTASCKPASNDCPVHGTCPVLRLLRGPITDVQEVLCIYTGVVCTQTYKIDRKLSSSEKPVIRYGLAAYLCQKEYCGRAHPNPPAIACRIRRSLFISSFLCFLAAPNVPQTSQPEHVMGCTTHVHSLKMRPTDESHRRRPYWLLRRAHNMKIFCMRTRNVDCKPSSAKKVAMGN